MVHIGIDMHKHFWHITALVEGDIVLALTLSKPRYDSFEKILAQFKGNHVRIVYKAGPGGFDLYDRLTADGIGCIVTPPSLIPTESGHRLKTDKKDSLKLAKLLESNMLKKVCAFPGKDYREIPLVSQGKRNHNIWGVNLDCDSGGNGVKWNGGRTLKYEWIFEETYDMRFWCQEKHE